jgi:acyl carrier protein
MTSRALPLHERLEEIFQTVFGDDDLVLTDDTTAADIPGWDSVAHINLMFTIEQAFGVQLAGAEMDDLDSVGALKRLLASKGAA